jgi:hypothetical protein
VNRRNARFGDLNASLGGRNARLGDLRARAGAETRASARFIGARRLAS